jgi:ComF family protein
MTPISVKTCDICGDTLGQTQSWGAPEPALSLSKGLADFARPGDIPATECVSCQEQKPHFAKAAAYGSYDGGLRELLHLLKYDRVEPVAGVLGTMLAEAIDKLDVVSESLVVVPVPLYAGKRRERGFNQAELIARKALKELPGKNLHLATDVLERTRPTISQIGLTRPQRVENLRGAFRVKHLSRVKGRDVLLVDDVMTTGTTASECARVLRRAGAKSVLVATVARTLKHNFSDSEFEPGTGGDARVPKIKFAEARGRLPADES